MMQTQPLGQSKSDPTPRSGSSSSAADPPTPAPTPAPVPAPQPATGGWHFAEWLSEFVGTAILVFGLVAVVTLVLRPGSAFSGWSEFPKLLLVGVFVGALLAVVATSPIGRRSGAHLNPAVTLAFRLTGHVHPHDLAGYWLSQLAGAIAGAGLARLVLGGDAGSVHYGVLAPTVAPLVAVALEALMTFLLVLTLFAFVSSARLARRAPLAAGAVVALVIALGAPSTGVGINPARSLGPNIIANRYGYWWLYVIAPIIGTLVAVAVWKLIPRVVLTAKLYHDPRYPSVMRTHLPALPPKKGR
jgi:aquaporin Z